MKKNLLALVLTAVVACSAASAMAADFEVKMLNKGAKGMMVFEPDLLKIAPGDTVKFVAVDKGHNIETMPGMLPDGAAPIKGKTSEDVTVTLTVPGVYGVKCLPHYGLGMVAVIVVGEPVNLAAAKAVKQVGKAKKVFEEIFERL